MNDKNPVRRIKQVWRSVPTMDGAGVKLNRVFGFQQMPQLDPFLLMDAFGSDKREDYVSGFPWHPHRGIETITYLLDGDVEHKDSLGNEGVINPGDIQWMTAGSGIIHQEMPRGNKKGEMWGFQLWANLPASNKMMAPRYREVKDAQIPVVKTPDGATVRIVAGKAAGVQGPVKDVVTDPEYLDVRVPANSIFTHAIEPGYTAFAYVVEGEGLFDANEPAKRHNEGEIVVYERAGDTVAVTTKSKPVRFLLISGKPLNQPVAWYGPVVMNTQAELNTAFEEYRNGTFVKKSGVA
jgi:redox-sensitive bicupin YhaK (pirin superfamily)